MKNKIFSIIFAVLFGFGTFAQSQEIEYDTIIYFPLTILECPMLFDTAANRQYRNNSGYDTLSPSGWKHSCYHDFTRAYNLWYYCRENTGVDMSIEECRLVGHSSIAGIRSFAQPY